MTYLTPPTIAPRYDLPPCDYAAHEDCGCGCGGSGACGGGKKLLAAVKACPWWVWLLAFCLVAAMSGNETMKTLAFGPKAGAKRKPRARRR